MIYSKIALGFLCLIHGGTESKVAQAAPGLHPTTDCLSRYMQNTTRGRQTQPKADCKSDCHTFFDTLQP